MWLTYIVLNDILSPNKYTITLKKNMVEWKISQEFILKNVDETRN